MHFLILIYQLVTKLRVIFRDAQYIYNLYFYPYLIPIFETIIILITYINSITNKWFISDPIIYIIDTITINEVIEINRMRRLISMQFCAL